MICTKIIKLQFVFGVANRRLEKLRKWKDEIYHITQAYFGISKGATPNFFQGRNLQRLICIAKIAANHAVY